MTYSVIANGIGWAVVRDGIVEANFATKEAATAFAQGVRDAQDGEDIQVIEGGEKGDTEPG